MSMSGVCFFLNIRKGQSAGDVYVGGASDTSDVSV